MKNSSTDRAQVRNTLLSNGYIPLPLAHKGVFIKGWSRVEVDQHWIEQYKRVGRYPNTGMRCDDLVAFDIDVLDETLADECEAYVEEHCGETDLCRVGQWPKRLLLYRLAHLDRTSIRSGRTGNYAGHMCELLATNGRQFAAFGIHPKTQEPYTWDSGSPLDTPLKELPEITAETALTVLDGLDELLEATGMEKIRNAHRRGVSGQDEYDLMPDTEVMVEGEIVKWKDVAPTLTTDGVFGNLWRPEQGEWGDSDAVHFYLAHGSREPAAHDFVNDCTHWESTFNADFAALLPPPPADKRSNVFVNDEIADMIENCVLLKDKTIRRLSSPTRAFGLDGWRQGNKHLRVPHPNPPASNPNKTIEFFEAWLSDPTTKRADIAMLRPDRAGEQIFRQGDLTVMNTYRAPEWPDDDEGEVGTFIQFIDRLFPNAGEADIFLSWLAHKFVNPHHRMHGLVMVTPAFGTGRGVLMQILEILFGQTYVKEIELDDLIGHGGQSTFNSYLSEALIVTVSEALETRDDMLKWSARHAAYEHLKRVCDPVARPMHIKRKYGMNETETVYASLLIASNHLDALAIPPGDRRLIVLDNTEEPLHADPVFQERILGWMQLGRNLLALCNYLKRYQAEVSTYKPFGAPPETPAKARMVEAGQSDTDRLFEIFVEQCEGDIVTPSQWYAFANRSRLEYDLDLPSDPARRNNALSAVLKQKARRIDAMPKSGIKVEGKPTRPWIVRNVARWRDAKNWDEVRGEILRNGPAHTSNVVKLPEKPR